MLKNLLVFFLLNFGGLYIGSLFTRTGTNSEWYAGLAKAPWTPPGWVFGVAWTLIMICFSVYLALAWQKIPDKKPLLLLFGISWILNVAWNPAFFHFQWTLIGLIIISALTIIIWLLFFKYLPQMKLLSALLLPYGIWLLIATSLNAYIVIMNK